MNEIGLSVSVVVYRPEIHLLCETLSSIREAYATLCKTRGRVPIQLCIVDNGGLHDDELAKLLAALAEDGFDHAVLRGQGNIGYGRGHNLAIDTVHSHFHLIVNPDINMDPEALVNAFDFFEANPDVGLIAPRIDDAHHAIQYLCHRYPAVTYLFVRGFLPIKIQRWFARRIGRYEMRDVINGRQVVWDPPVVSGCFMLFRTNLLKQLSGFDPRYFLYFEDYDLSLRAHQLTHLAYVPAIRAVHYGGGAAHKGLIHIGLFLSSALKFYNRFGWKWL